MFKSLVSVSPNLHSKAVNYLQWNSDGNYLGSVSIPEKTVKISQLDSKSMNAKVLHTVPCSNVPAAVCWHPTDPIRFAICGDDKTVDIWDVRASKAVSKIPTSGQNINMSWSPNGKNIAVTNRNDNLVILDVAESKQVKPIKFLYEINELVWTNNSDHILLASAGADLGCIEFMKYNDESVTLIDSINCHTSNCYCIKIDPTYTKLCCGSVDHTVSIWDLDDLICYCSVPLEAPVRCVSFNHNGNYIVASTDNPKINVIDSAKGTIVSVIETTYNVNSVAFHPKFDLLATAIDDRSGKSSPAYVKLYSNKM